MDNLLIQVSGKKRVVLFSPREADKLYLDGECKLLLTIIIMIIMDVYRAPSQESLGHLQYKLNTQMHARRYTHTHICMHAHTHQCMHADTQCLEAQLEKKKPLVSSTQHMRQSVA